MRKWQEDAVFFMFMLGLIFAGGECKTIDKHAESVVQLKQGAHSAPQGWETGRNKDAVWGLAVSPPLLSERLSLKGDAIGFERILRERGFNHEHALLCLLVTAYHESSFRVTAEAKERDGSVSRGLLQMNSRGMGRGIDREKLLTIAGQVDVLSKHHGFLRWYREVKTKKLDVVTAMKKLTDQVIRCAQKHRMTRILTAQKWQKELSKIGGGK